MSAEAWDIKLEGKEEFFGGRTYWLANPMLQSLYHHTAGPASGDWLGESVAGAAARSGPSVLVSIGCGTAEPERDLLARGAISHLVTIDPSRYSYERQVEMGRSFPGQWTAILGTAETINQIAPDLSAQIILFNMSLHHSSDVYLALKNAHAILARSETGGTIVANEYVGPPRFDFGARDRELMNSIFRTIPERFRRLQVEPFTILEGFAFPDPLAVAELDPTEAPESDRIRPLFYSQFQVLQDIPLPGTFFQFGFNNLAGNFRPDDPEAVAEVMRLYLRERSDFAESTHFRLLVGTIERR